MRLGWTVGRGRARGRGLAGQMIAFTMVAVAAAVVVIGGVSVAGVYDLAQGEDASRLIAYRQLLADDISGHLALTERIVDSLGSVEALRPVASETLAIALERAADANAEYFDLLVLVDASGSVKAQSGPDGLGASVASLRVFREGALKRTAWFGVEPGAAPNGWDLWAVRKMDGDTGLVLLARLRTGFMTHLLDEVSLGTESRTAFVMSQDGAIVQAGVTSALPPKGSPAFKAGSEDLTLGSVSWVDTTYGPMEGYYQDLTAVPELGWRVVVMESGPQAMQRARSALLPAGVATVLAALLALVSATIFAKRLVAPLGAFERHARDIAAGGYVRPLPVERDDEVGRLADAFNDIGARLNSLQDVSRLLASAADPRDVLDAVLSAIGHILGTTDAAVLLSAPGTDQLVLVRGRGLRSPDVRFSVSVAGSSPLSAAFREVRPVPFEGRSAAWARSVFQLFDAPSDRSGVAVPLSVGDDVLGVVVALSPGPKPITEAQVETLRAFSAQAAVAVRTSRLFEHEHVSRREAEALREVAELIAGTHDLAPALDRAAAVAAELLGMSECAVAVEDRSGFGLPPGDSPERDAELLALWRARAPEAGAERSPFEPIFVESSAGWSGCPTRNSGLLLVPLVRDGHTRGVLALVVPEGAAAPGSRELTLAGTLARQISLALDNAALLQEARARAANLETIFRISQAVSSSLQINVVLNRVLDVVQKIFSADAVSLMAYDAGKHTIDTSMARGVGNREMLYLQVLPGQDIPGEVFSTRNPVVCDDLSEMDTPLARLATDQDLRSLLAVPLLARGRSTGVLTVYDRSPNAFSTEDRELLLTFASQVALAIDTASLYGREHHVASVLQASILPETLTEMPGLESATFYLPAGVEAEIGGDYYDLFAMHDGSVLVAIGDVCGKGVQAATKTSMIKHSLRGMVSAGATPAEALSELNRLVSASGDPSDIVTAWVGFIDAERRTLTYADGGHPPALLRRADGHRFERLGPTGALLGAIEGAPYGQCTIDLRPGDLLVTYTDGVTEARRSGHFFGEGRLMRAVRGATTAAEAVASLLESMGAFSHGAMHDDAAVLIVRVIGGDMSADAPD